MPQGNTEGTDCSADGGACLFVRDILTRVGDKWSVLIVVSLGDGTRRFSELKRRVEIGRASCRERVFALV